MPIPPEILESLIPVGDLVPENLAEFYEDQAGNSLLQHPRIDWACLTDNTDLRPLLVNLTFMTGSDGVVMWDTKAMYDQL